MHGRIKPNEREKDEGHATVTFVCMCVCKRGEIFSRDHQSGARARNRKSEVKERYGRMNKRLSKRRLIVKNEVAINVKRKMFPE